MDKRRFIRFKVHLPIAFSGYKSTGQGTVVNLSRGGCGVDGEQKVKRGSYLRLRLTLSEQEAPLVVDWAAVRWAMGRAFGLEFLRMRSQERERLRRFLSTLETGPGH